MQKIIIDTDPGVDDAIAIMLLSKSNKFDIRAITTVAGNSTIENTTANAAYLKKLLNLNCPVYSGAKQALYGPFIEGQVHGATGLTGIKHNIKAQITNDAPQRIVDEINKNPGEITILCLGPQTNIAQAFRIDPSLKNKIRQIVIMGGAILSPGNKSKVAEFNIFLDPEASEIVFNSSTPKTMIPLEVCYKTPIYLSDIERMPDNAVLKPILNSLITPYIKLLSKFEGVEGAIVYDALAAFYLINQDAYKTRDLEVRIETKGNHTRGMTVPDLRAWGEKTPNVTLAYELDRDAFIQYFQKTLSV